MKWNINRDSPEDKLRDFIKWMKAVKRDTIHHVCSSTIVSSYIQCRGTVFESVKDYQWCVCVLYSVVNQIIVAFLSPQKRLYSNWFTRLLISFPWVLLLSTYHGNCLLNRYLSSSDGLATTYSFFCPFSWTSSSLPPSLCQMTRLKRRKCLWNLWPLVCQNSPNELPVLSYQREHDA